MNRVVIELDESQDRILRRRAAEERRTPQDLCRGAVARYLVETSPEAPDRYAPFRQMLALASEFLGLIHRAEGAGILEVRPIDPALWLEAEAIFPRYADVRLSFTDCTSFALLLAEPVDEVFGFDDHFRIMGHVLQPST